MIEYLETPELRIYPNPAKDYLNIILPDDLDANGVMYSMMGNKVAEFSGKGKIIVHTSNVDAGCYCVRIVSNAMVYQSKIIIQD